MRILRIPLIVLALVGLIAFAGCGGDDRLSNEEYTEQATEILTSFSTEFQALGAEIQGAQDEEAFSSGVDEAESVIQGTIDEYSELEPPEEAQEGHDQVVSSLEGFSSSLTEVSEAAGSGDEEAVQQAATELQAAGVEFQTQLTEAGQLLEEAGITFGSGEVPEEGAEVPEEGGETTPEEGG